MSFWRTAAKFYVLPVARSKIPYHQRPGEQLPPAAIGDGAAEHVEDVGKARGRGAGGCGEHSGNKTTDAATWASGICRASVPPGGAPGGAARFLRNVTRARRGGLL